MGSEGQTRPSALLVIAHPDDETMFFAPALQALRYKFSWHILCLSTGMVLCACVVLCSSMLHIGGACLIRTLCLYPAII